MATARSTTSRLPRAVILVRNPCTHDARVLREAETLRSLGFDVVVLAVVSRGERRRKTVLEGTSIVRLNPSSPFGRLRRRLRANRVSTGARDEPSPTVSRTADSGPAAPRALLRLHRLLVTFDYYRLGLGAVLRHRPQLLHCNDYNTMWIGTATRTATGCALVYDSHELWPDRNLRPEPRWWLMACEALFVRAAHRTITTSPGYANVIAKRYRVPMPTVVRNIPRAAAPSGRAKPEDGTAVYAGALTVNRGLEQAIDALSHVPEARLRLVGPGAPAYIAALRERADRSGVSDRLEITPPVEPAGLIAALRPATIGLALIQPTCLSYRLTLPNKVFEYIAAELPVLGADIPGIAEFVQAYGVGRMTTPDDTQEIARTLRLMLQPEEQARLRERVRDAARELTWEHERELLASVYRDALRRAA